MDFSSILSTLWNKVSSPVPNILIGIVFLIFAPDDLRWFGLIFIAIGLSHPIDWAINWVKGKIKNRNFKEKIIATLGSLNQEEKRIIYRMLQNNEQTIAVQHSDYHDALGWDGPLGGREEYIRIFGTCSGLKTKGMFVTSSLEEVTTFTFFAEVWEIMKELYNKEPDLFEPQGN